MSLFRKTLSRIDIFPRNNEIFVAGSRDSIGQ